VVKLVEIFKELDIVVEGTSQFGRYRALYRLVPTENKITEQDLQNYIQKMQQKYPDKNFQLNIRLVNGKFYYVITRKSTITLPDGTKKRVWDRIPIYIDLENQKFYIPQYYVKRRPKLAKYIAMVVLSTLKVAKTKYLQTVVKNEL
jgi:hypothetical protein